MPHRTFEVPAMVPDDDPITFDVAGRKLTCLAEPPLGAYLLIGGSMVFKRDMLPFIRACLVEGDDAVLDEAMMDKRYRMGQETIEDLFWYVVDSYGEKLGTPIIVRKQDPESAEVPARTEGE